MHILKVLSGAYAEDTVSTKEALDIIKVLTPVLKTNTKRWAIAGSFRRGQKKTFGDLDFVVACLI